jgi:hypothetical protein
MVKKRSIKDQECNILLSEAVLGVENGKYKTANAAATALGLRPDTVRRRISGASKTHKEGHQNQQLLSKNQEQTLLKWIKGLTLSGYAPSHRILREVAEEVRSNKCRVFQVSSGCGDLQLSEACFLSSIPDQFLGLRNPKLG